MTARDVHASLALRWPDSDYLLISEAPEDSSRTGRKIDLLVLALWQSRGFELDAVEVKVSLPDWRREAKNPAKADFWWRHSHRFWVAVPATLAARVAPDLPAGWGLLACEPNTAPTVHTKPVRRDAEPLPWGTTIGVLRAAADAGVNALRRAEQKGREEGQQKGYSEGIEASASGQLQAQLDQLRERVEAFEQASGLDLSDPWQSTAELGHYVAIVQQELQHPRSLAFAIGNAADQAIRDAQILLSRATEAKTSAQRLSAAIADANPTPPSPLAHP